MINCNYLMEGISSGIMEKDLDKINGFIFNLLKEMLPSSFPLTLEHIVLDKKFKSILIQLSQNFNRIMITDEKMKGTYFLTLSICINNRVSASFLPEDHGILKNSIDLQKISLAFSKIAVKIFMENSITLKYDDINRLNYHYNVIEANLGIIQSNMIGSLNKLENEQTHNTFRAVNRRLDSLIKRNPDPNYFRLQSLLLNHLGSDIESRNTIKKIVSGNYLEDSLSNLKVTGFRQRNRNELFPVRIYS